MPKISFGKKGIKDVNTIGVGIDAGQLTSEKPISDNEFVKQIQREKKHGIRHLLYIGKIEQRRNPYLLLDIMERLSEINNLKLIVIGSGEKEYVQSWQDSLARRELEDQVTFVGKIPQKELPPIYNNCDLFLLPTSFEIFGMVLLEAMFYGAVPLTTVNGGSSVLFQGDLSELVMDTLDESEWVRKIEELLSNQVHLDELGQKVRSAVRKNFTWDALAPHFEACYWQLLSRNSRGLDK